MWLLIIDGIILIGSMLYLSGKKKKQQLTSDLFGFFVGAMWSIVTASPFLVYARDNLQILIIGLVLSIIQFVILFFVSKWIYRKLDW